MMHGQTQIKFPFIHLQVQPKDVEMVIMCCTVYLLNYRCEMMENNYNTMITQYDINYRIFRQITRALSIQKRSKFVKNEHARYTAVDISLGCTLYIRCVLSI